MSDNRRFSYTPIVVGIVIALLGILTGFYIADNARQQLALLSASENQPSSDSEQPDPQAATPQFQDTDTPAAIDEPLPDVVIDVPLPDTADNEQQSDTVSNNPQPSAPAASNRSTDDDDSADQDDDLPIEVDDFEEVPL